MGSFSLVHWLVVIVVGLLVFGPKKLANVGKDLGEGLRGFKQGLTDTDDAANEKPALPKTERKSTPRSDKNA